MKKLTLFFIVCTIALRLTAQEFICHPADERLTPREHPVNILKMKVEVAFEPEKGLVKGKVTHTFKPLQKKVDTIFFDGPAIRIKSAKLDGKDIKYTTSSTGVTVYLTPALSWDKEYSLAFEYEANPQRGIYFIGWNQPEDPANTNPWRIRRQIWTQGQGIDNRHWIPMYDDANDKFLTEMTVVFDKKYKVLSNGNKLLEKDNRDGTVTWNYAMTKPHAGYLVMLAIGDYAVAERKTKRGTPLHLWYYPDLKEWAEPTYRYTEEMFDFLEAQTGIPYPWESYSEVMVQDFLYGAMENTTATIFGDFFLVDNRAYLDRNYVGVNCHELTHQWFGDYITHRSNSEIWLHESYATHYPKIMQKSLYGYDYYKWAEWNEMQSALAAGKKDSYPVRHSKGGSSRHYPKGSVVINMLKYVAGEEEFNRALNHYLKTHAYQNVETNDLYQALQDVLGIAPSWFFEQWIYRGGEPHYQVGYESIQNGFTRVSVKQIHERNEGTGLFKMPVNIQVFYKDGGADSIQAWIEKEYEVVDVPNTGNRPVAFVLFDAGNHVLKNLTFSRSFDELQAQALSAPEMIDRYEALVALRNTPFDKKMSLLERMYVKEKFYGIRAEVASQLAQENAVSQAFIKTLRDEDVNVRKAAIAAVNTISAPLVPVFEKLLTDSSYSIVETALEKLCRDYPENTAKYLAATKDVLGMNNAVRIKWLEIAGATQGAQHWETLAAFAGPQYEFRTRINAFEALKRTNYFNQTVFNNLLDAAVAKNSRLAGPAYSTLEVFAKQTAYRQNILGWIKEHKPGEKEMGVLKQLGI